MFYLGRGLDYAVALEGSLKLKKYHISIQKHMLVEN